MGLSITDKIIRCDAASHSAQLMHYAEGAVRQGRPASGWSPDYGPVQAPDHLGIAVWQWQAALRRGLIPPADRDRR
jgi:hypothetical protein